MPRLLLICALLLVLFQLSVPRTAESAQAAWLDATASEHPAYRAGDTEAPEDGTSERTSADDLTDESALAHALQLGAWRSTSGAQPASSGLARGRAEVSAPFKPPRGAA